MPKWKSTPSMPSAPIGFHSGTDTSGAKPLACPSSDAFSMPPRPGMRPRPRSLWTCAARWVRRTCACMGRAVRRSARAPSRVPAPAPTPPRTPDGTGRSLAHTPRPAATRRFWRRRGGGAGLAPGPSRSRVRSARSARPTAARPRARGSAAAAAGDSQHSAPSRGRAKLGANLRIPREIAARYCRAPRGHAPFLQHARGVLLIMHGARDARGRWTRGAACRACGPVGEGARGCTRPHTRRGASSRPLSHVAALLLEHALLDFAPARRGPQRSTHDPRLPRQWSAVTGRPATPASAAHHRKAHRARAKRYERE